MGLDTETVRTFVDHDYARVVNVVTFVCGDRNRAEDAVQDALVRAWATHKRIDVLSAWVTTVALNRTRDVARRAAAESRAYGRLDGRRDPMGDDTHHEALDGALAGCRDANARSSRSTTTPTFRSGRSRRRSATSSPATATRDAVTIGRRSTSGVAARPLVANGRGEAGATGSRRRP
jgi:hypothetical protein